MKITLLTIGTRGDIQPFVALGAGLGEAGHEVTLATGGAFEGFVSEHGLRYAPLDVDLLESLQSPGGREAISGKNLLGTARRAASMYRKVLDQEWSASQGADAIVYHPKALGGYHISEALRVPGFLAHPVPMLSPTRAFPNPILPVTNLGGSLNRMSYGLFLGSLTAPFHRTINRWRRESLGLPPQRLLASELYLRGRPVPTLVCCSAHVVVPPADWDASSVVTGYWFLDTSRGWTPPHHLVDFLEAGPPPVYVGFGSLGEWTNRKVVAAALGALERTGTRGVFAAGGGRVSPNPPDGVCIIESAPHDWLFPRMTAVVHHGGAGTTAEGLRAGRPTLVCPTTINDQAFWGRRVFEAGAGPRPIPQRRLTVGALSRAIHVLVADGGIRARAAELGERIRTEQGVARAVKIVEERVEVWGGG